MRVRSLLLLFGRTFNQATHCRVVQFEMTGNFDLTVPVFVYGFRDLSIALGLSATALCKQFLETDSPYEPLRFRHLAQFLSPRNMILSASVCPSHPNRLCALTASQMGAPPIPPLTYSRYFSWAVLRRCAK